MRRARRVGLLLLAVMLIGAVILVVRPFRPAALPPGATPLAMLTQPWRLWPPSGFGACPMALLSPIRVERDEGALVFTAADSEERLSVVWPNGFSARLLIGRAELVAPDGSVLAREGDVISNIGGGTAANGEFLLCFDLATKPLVDRAP